MSTGMISYDFLNELKREERDSLSIDFFGVICRRGQGV